FGDGIEAFYPVLRTEDIGNLGTICCSDGEYPEAIRALAFGGAEVVYRPSEAVPMTNVGYPGGGTWMLQNRAHAHFNNVYMICPNVGPVYLHPKMKHPYDIGGGHSHIVDYMGNVLSYSPSGYNTFVTGIVDIEALRQFRVMNLNSNWMKDRRTAGASARGPRRGGRRVRHQGGGRAGVPPQLSLQLPRHHPHGSGLPGPGAGALRRPVRVARKPVRARVPGRPGPRVQPEPRA